MVYCGMYMLNILNAFILSFSADNIINFVFAVSSTVFYESHGFKLLLPVYLNDGFPVMLMHCIEVFHLQELVL